MGYSVEGGTLCSRRLADQLIDDDPGLPHEWTSVIAELRV